MEMYELENTNELHLLFSVGKYRITDEFMW